MWQPLGVGLPKNDELVRGLRGQLQYASFGGLDVVCSFQPLECSFAVLLQNVIARPHCSSPPILMDDSKHLVCVCPWHNAWRSVGTHVHHASVGRAFLCL